MIARHSFIYLVARILPGVINFAALAIYTRLLLPGEYGEYSLVIATISVLQLFLFGWLNLGLLRFYARFENQRDTFIATTLTLYGLLALASLISTVIAYLLIKDPHIAKLVFSGGILLVAWALFELNLQLYNSSLRPYHYGGLMLGKSLLALCISTILVWLQFGAQGIIWGLLLGNLLPPLLFCSHEWRNIRLRATDWHIVREMLWYGLPLTAAALLNEVVNSADRIMLAWLDKVDNVGQYAAGYDLARFLLVMLMISVNLAAYPVLVKTLEQQGITAARQQSRQHATLLFGIAFPATAGLIAIAPNLVYLFIGEAFRDAVTQTVPLIAFATLLAGIKSYYFDLAFQLGKHTIGQVWILIAASALNVLLNLLLIPQAGIFGAAWATIITYAFALILSISNGRSHFPLDFPVRTVFLLAISALGMLLVLVFLSTKTGWLWLALQLFLGVSSYGSLLLLLNVGGARNYLASRMSQISLR